MNPYPGDRVRTPYSDKTVGTIAVVKLAHAAMLSDGGIELSETENPGRTLCFVLFDRPCGPGPDSEAWFDSRDLRPVEAARDEIIKRYGKLMDLWEKAQRERDEARVERDEAIEKLRRAARVLTGVDSTT